MTEMASGEKRFLNYQGATFKRSVIYLGFACLTFLACIFIKFKPDNIPPPGAVPTISLYQLLLGFVACCLLLHAVFEAFFVLYQNYMRLRQYAFDQNNFYIIRKDATETIPYHDIFQIAYAGFDTFIRGFYRYYRLRYNSGDREKMIYLKIYSRMDKNYRDFEKLVTEKNPSVEIRNWSTSLDWLARLIKRRKSRKKEDYFT